MANMSYCRFQNTYADLRDCMNWLSENDPSELSGEERKCYEALVRKASELVMDYSDDVMGVSFERIDESEAL